MAQISDLIVTWASANGLQPTVSVQRLGARRAHALGRLVAIWPLLGLPWVVRVRTWEHGRDELPAGSLMAVMRVRSGDAVQVQRLAGQVHQIVARFEGEKGLRVIVCVEQATRWDRLRGWASWRWRSLTN